MNRLSRAVSRVWNDPVWSKVIASLMLAGLAAIGSYFFGLWPHIASALNTAVPIPFWAIILGVPALVGAVPCIKRLVPDPTPGYLNYTRDHILDIDWHWRWTSDKWSGQYRLYDLKPRCPSCKALLEINDYTNPFIYCLTEHCDWQWPSHKYRTGKKRHEEVSSSSTLETKVQTEIERRIQTGEWRHVRTSNGPDRL